MFEVDSTSLKNRNSTYSGLYKFKDNEYRTNSTIKVKVKILVKVQMHKKGLKRYNCK